MHSAEHMEPPLDAPLSHDTTHDTSDNAGKKVITFIIIHNSYNRANIMDFRDAILSHLVTMYQAICENFASILKLETLGGTTDFHIQQWRRYASSTFKSIWDNYKISVWLLTGIRLYILNFRHGKVWKFEIVCYS